MDIHKPKPWHGVREFLKEYVIIVVGVLTALGAEQAVETLHRQAEIREAKQALNREIGFDLASMEFTVAQTDCFERRLDELARWRDSMAAGKSLHLMGPVAGPQGILFRTSVWQVATGGAVALMPFEDRIAYGQIYDSIRNNTAFRQSQGDYWNDLRKLTLAPRLDERQLLDAANDIDRLRSINSSLKHNLVYMRQFAHRVGATSRPQDQTGVRESLKAGVAAFCRPVVER